MDADERMFLKAVVAVWLVNGQNPVDGANEPREFVHNDYFGSASIVNDLVSDGYLANASGEATYDPANLEVWPTAKGLFEVLV